MIKIWYNIRNGYLIKYTYNTDTDEICITKQVFNRLKNIKHF